MHDDNLEKEVEQDSSPLKVYIQNLPLNATEALSISVDLIRHTVVGLQRIITPMAGNLVRSVFRMNIPIDTLETEQIAIQNINTIVRASEMLGNKHSTTLNIPLIGKLHILHSKESLAFLAEQPPEVADKGNTNFLAALFTGDAEAREFIMGRHADPQYKEGIKTVEDFITKIAKGVKTNTRTILEANTDIFDSPITIKDIQFITSSMVLSTLFPCHDWSKTTIVNFINKFEEANDIIGSKALINGLSIMSDEKLESLLAEPMVQHASTIYSNLFDELFASEAAVLDPLYIQLSNAQESGDEESVQILQREIEKKTGLLSKLSEIEGITKADIIANGITTVSAAAGTVASAYFNFLSKWITNPGSTITENGVRKRIKMRDYTTNLTNEKLDKLIYSIVGDISPLPISLRIAEQNIVNSQLGINIEEDEPILAFLYHVAHKQTRLGPRMYYPWEILKDNDVQERLRYAWGLYSPNVSNEEGNQTFCRGFGYSLGLLKELISLTLPNFEDGKVEVRNGIRFKGVRTLMDTLSLKMKRNWLIPLEQ